MSDVLSAGQRRLLDTSVQRARTIAEEAAGAALGALAVSRQSKPGYLSDDNNRLRLALREKARQLDDMAGAGVDGQDLPLLTREVAYEQWHRLLFARFLEVNGLLRHPDWPTVPVSLQDCADLAPELGEPDAWSVAASFASTILPGVFRLDDPAVQVRFATEHRLALEGILQDLPEDVFRAEDALGWVYQFWQTAEKKRVNESGVKIGGTDLSPVTQLFTENYMVRFLLENSLGAWWATRHPSSPLVAEWQYLRTVHDVPIADGGVPAAGTFAEWPTTAAAVTTMDPCCGSGHFLVALFGMLWRMRAEEEGLSPADAQDAVLRDNIFGLELDPRCTQIATFNVALEAWKQGGFRDLPAPQIACSGIPVRGTQADWEDRGGDDPAVRNALARLHSLFRNADTLGSLIAPRADDLDGALFGTDLSVGAAWETVRQKLIESLDAEDRDGSVLGHVADDVAQAASLLARQYTLVATNPPYITRQRLNDIAREYLDSNHGRAGGDLSSAFIERSLAAAHSTAMVLPLTWHAQPAYRDLRKHVLQNHRWDVTAVLGSGAFRTISGEVVTTSLSVLSAIKPTSSHRLNGYDVSDSRGIDEKAGGLCLAEAVSLDQAALVGNASHRVVVTSEATIAPRLSVYAKSRTGTRTADNARLRLNFWELNDQTGRWARLQVAPTTAAPHSGREYLVLWENGKGTLADLARLGYASIQGAEAWGKQGVCLGLTGSLRATLYTGQVFDMSCGVIWPVQPRDLPAIWAYCTSPEFSVRARELDKQMKLTTKTLVQVPFDRERWQKVADELYPNGLPEPHSDDPTQWLFKGEIPTSTHPLHVAVARLLGYRWPDQPADPTLDKHVDTDGIVALQTLPGEPDAATRLRALLADAYGEDWSSTLERRLVVEAGGKSGRLEDWLRDTFFAEHVKVFGNRPFLWHIWDGAKDGFSAIVNYHRLDHATLEKLAWAPLGHWIERQTQEAAAGRAGADTRLAKAKDLQARLQLILDGEAPHDVFVRWKPLREQPIGWHPDLDDGVRLNIRPFVTAGVLRVKLDAKIKWGKDRGTNPDGSERINDLHPTLAERRAARAEFERSSTVDAPGSTSGSASQGTLL